MRDLVTTYQQAEGASQRGRFQFSRLTRLLGKYRLRDITDQQVVQYTLALRKEGAGPSAINLELKALGWVLKWAQQRGLITTLPTIYLVHEERAPIADRHRGVWGVPLAPGSARPAAPAVVSPSAPGPRPRVTDEMYRTFSVKYPNVSSDEELARHMNHDLGRSDITRKHVFTARHRISPQS